MTALRRARDFRRRTSPAALIMAATWAGYAANAVSLVVSARALGATGRGAYSSLLVWAMTSASVCDLSLGPALARAMAQGHRSDRLRRFLPVAFGVASLAAILLMVIVLRTFLSRSVPGGAGMLIALSVPPALVLAAWGVYVLQGLGRRTGYALARMLPPSIGMVLIVAQAARGLTLEGALAAFSAGYWLVGAWCALSAWRYFSVPNVAGSPSPAGRGEGWTPIGLLTYGARAHLGTLASIASSRLDLLLLTAVVPLAAVGNYGLAVSLTMPIAIVGSALAAANYQRIAAPTPASPADVEGTSLMVKGVWRRFIVPTIALAGMAAGAALIVPRLLGHEFDAAVVPALSLSVGTMGLGALGLGTSMLQARGMPGTSSTLFVAAALSSAVTLLLLVPRYGIVGAAISSTLTYLLIGACCVPLTLRQWSSGSNLFPRLRGRAGWGL